MYREPRIGPTNRLNTTRYNLIASGVTYTGLGALFCYLDPSFAGRRFEAHLPFIALGGVSILSGLLSYRSLLFARRSLFIHMTLLVLYAANFAFFAAAHGFEAPYFAWALLGAFGTCAALVVYNRFSLIVFYAWTCFGLNIIAGAYYGTGTLLFHASNLFTAALIVPMLGNIIRHNRFAKERQNQILVEVLDRQKKR